MSLFHQIIGAKVAVRFDRGEYEICSSTGDTAHVTWNGYHNICEVTEANYNSGTATGCQQRYAYRNNGDVETVSVLAANSGATRYFLCALHTGSKFKITCPAPKAKCNTHTCPTGTSAKTNAASIDCVGELCSIKDDYICCNSDNIGVRVDVDFTEGEHEICTTDGKRAKVSWNGYHNICEVFSEEDYNNGNAADCLQRYAYKNYGYSATVIGLNARPGLERYFLCASHTGSKFKISCPGAKCSTYACPSGKVSKANASQIECVGDPCTAGDEDTCCEEELVCQAGDRYAQTGRVYDGNMTECPDQATPITAEQAANFSQSTLNGNQKLCRCSSCETLFEAMVAEGEICYNGEWRNKGACSTFLCPAGFVNKTNKENLECAEAFCRTRGTEPESFGYGTEGWGQGEPKLDLYRCCDYANTSFTYVEHTRFEDGTWKAKVEGGHGCLSQKCYEKAFTENFQHMICNWNSGACNACDFCQVHDTALPDKAKFGVREGCTRACKNYLYLKPNDPKRLNICQHRFCDHCEFCKNSRATCDSHECPVGFTKKSNAAELHCDGPTCGTHGDTRTCCNPLGFDQKTNCHQKCSRYITNEKFEDRADRFCSWEMCNGCDFCQNNKATCDTFTCPTGLSLKENAATIHCEGTKCNREHDLMHCCDTDLFTIRPGCDKKCARYFASDEHAHRKNQFCNWGLCRNCNYCAQNRAYCTTHTCPTGMALKSNAVDLFCEGTPCGSNKDTETCCDAPENEFTVRDGCSEVCSRYLTNADFMDRTDEFCNYHICEKCDFCNQDNRRVTCDTFNCPTGYTQKCNSEDILCEGNVCDEPEDILTCCDPPAFANSTTCHESCEMFTTNSRLYSQISSHCDWPKCKDCNYCKIVRGEMDEPTTTCATTCVPQDISGTSANVFRQDASTPSSNIVDGDLSTYSGPSIDNCADNSNDCTKLYESGDISMGSSITDFVELTLPQSYDVKKVYIQRRRAGTGNLGVQIYAKVGSSWEQCATASIQKSRNQEVICEKTTSIIRVTGNIDDSDVDSFSFAEMKVSGCSTAAASASAPVAAAALRI